MFGRIIFGLTLTVGALAFGAGAFFVLVNAYEDDPEPRDTPLPEMNQNEEATGVNLEPDSGAVTTHERIENGKFVTTLTPAGAMPPRDPREHGGSKDED